VTSVDSWAEAEREYDERLHIQRWLAIATRETHAARAELDDAIDALLAAHTRAEAALARVHEVAEVTERLAVLAAGALS
jgi:hypothetical protein